MSIVLYVYSSNWDLNQLFLNISVILKCLSVATIFYIERFVQYLWAAVVAEVEALYYIWGLEH